MSRYYDGPVPIKERKPKPAQAKTMVKDLEPQAGSSASSQLVSTTTTGDSLAKAPVSSTSDALESRETLQSVLEGGFLFSFIPPLPFVPEPRGFLALELFNQTWNLVGKSAKRC